MTLEEFRATRITITPAQIPQHEWTSEEMGWIAEDEPDATLLHIYSGPEEMKMAFLIAETPRGFVCEWHHPEDTVVSTLVEAEELILADYINS